ncbi:FG-GAP repeat domain-containing protein [Streptomyces sp. NPDC056987]|uniref:FG-GAP repeat domain-containing protein n=1 Tax=Streptomyces sp. NPDC056987 TaxID=3345988 RepID=UPI0036399314
MRRRRIRQARTTATKTTTTTTTTTTKTTTTKTTKTAIGLTACTALLLPLTACTDASSASSASSSSGASVAAKNGDTAPGTGASAVPRRPVPRGRGSRLPDDFNGDGHPDLVLNDLVKAAGDTYGDDAGIGIVYGTAPRPGDGAKARRFDPAVRQTLDPRESGARVGGALPAAFDAEAACDLDGDGFGDLIIATDPPYDGIGMPPVPLQILFGGPQGLTGRAVVLKIPAKARAGDEWPDHPVCGDFDGDGRTDLAVTASAGQVTFLRGPFSRTGAPRSAAAPVQGGGTVLAAPEPKGDVNGDGYDDLVVSPRAHAAGAAARGTLLLGGPDGPGRPGTTYSFPAVRKPPAPRLPGVPAAKAATEILRATDGYLLTRTHRGERTDLLAVYAPASGPDAKAPAFAPHPLLTFSTSIFLP